MTPEIKIREALATALLTRGKQAEISKALNVHPSTVKRWSEGAEMNPPVVTLLDWYFFGTVPPKLTKLPDHRHTLDFDEGEWAVIGALARREGVSEAVWITSRIRSYLAYVQDSPAERLRVAEDEAQFGDNGKTG